jgi:hypothetical protein
MASMAERPDPHAGESVAGPHDAADDHGDDGGHDDHAHGGAMTLGPIDVPAWSAVALGVLLGLLVVLALTKSAF